MDVLRSMLLALTLTIAVEMGVLWLLGERHGKVLRASVAMNILTNVSLNCYLVFVAFSVLVVLVGEMLVVLVEALWYQHYLKCWEQASLYSLLCNAISFLTGLLLMMLLY